VDGEEPEATLEAWAGDELVGRHPQYQSELFALYESTPAPITQLISQSDSYCKIRFQTPMYLAVVASKMGGSLETILKNYVCANEEQILIEEAIEMNTKRAIDVCLCAKWWGLAPCGATCRCRLRSKAVVLPVAVG
jgi:hypothetical protein